MTPNRRRILALHALLLILLLATSPTPAEYTKPQKERIAALAEPYRQFLEDVELLISDEETEAFLGLEKDYQRDTFIERFWRERDRYPDTTRNEFRERWYERIDYARMNFERMDTDRARLLLSNGPPTNIITPQCTQLYPLQIWYYAGSEQVPFEFILVFVKRFGAGVYRLWYPSDGLEAIFDTAFLGGGVNGSLENIQRLCKDGETVARALAWVLGQGNLGYGNLMLRIDRKPEPAVGEWVATFNAYSTDLPAGAPTFEAHLDIDFPSRRQSRTVVQGVFRVPLNQVGRADLAGTASYNLVLNGEVLQDGKLFESFRYKFDFPASDVPGTELPLVFQRILRPGDYNLVLKLEDLNSKKLYREERPLTVPKLDAAQAVPEPDDPATAALLREAYQAIAAGETTIKLLQPPGELHAGLLRLETLTTGQGFDKVTFFLDDKPILTKKRPPYSVELDLGQLPRTRNLRVVGYDAAGEELASDELLLNAGGHRFAVRLVEPRRGKSYQQSLQAEAAVEVPEGEVVERVEFFLNETLVATLYQPPYTQTILLPEAGTVAYVRAVAYLPDGNSTEDLVFVNAPEYLEEVDVQFVELYTTVLDREGRPVQGLSQDTFQVLEDGVPQQIARFEQVEDRPFHASILLDVSASMEDSLTEVRDAALGFFQQAISPRDRAALITFNDRPNLAVKFTSDVSRLAGGLAGLKAERGTSLYDSLVFGLYYFNGIRGQKAILVLSDGKDESSRFSFEDSLEYARRAGVTLYAIGLKDAADDRDSRKKLTQLAEETGGRSFFIQDAAELPAIYDTIQQELRSQYLLAYQSTNTNKDSAFREIEVKLTRSGLEAKTLRGYYP